MTAMNLCVSKLEKLQRYFYFIKMKLAVKKLEVALKEILFETA